MLRPEDICLHVGNPLLSILGDAQVSHSFLNIFVDMVPVKLGVVFPQVPRRLVTELLVEAEFLEFVKKRGALLDAVGITELTNEIDRLTVERARIRQRAKELGTTVPVWQKYDRVCFDKELMSQSGLPDAGAIKAAVADVEQRSE